MWRLIVCFGSGVIVALATIGVYLYSDSGRVLVSAKSTGLVPAGTDYSKLGPEEIIAFDLAFKQYSDEVDTGIRINEITRWMLLLFLKGDPEISISEPYEQMFASVILKENDRSELAQRVSGFIAQVVKVENKRNTICYDSDRNRLIAIPGTADGLLSFVNSGRLDKSKLVDEFVKYIFSDMPARYPELK